MTRNFLSLAALLAVLTGELAQAQTRQEVGSEESYVRQVSHTMRSRHYFSRGMDCGCDAAVPSAELWEGYACDSCPPCGTNCRSHTFPPVLSTVFHGLGNLFHRLGDIRPCRLSITCCSTGSRRGFSRRGCASGGGCDGCATCGSNRMLESPLQAVPTMSAPMMRAPAVDNPFKDEIAEPPMPPRDARYVPQRSKSAIRSRVTDKTRVAASIRSTTPQASVLPASRSRVRSASSESAIRLVEVSEPVAVEPPGILEISTAEPIQFSSETLEDESEQQAKPVRQTSSSTRSRRSIPVNPLR